MTKQEFIKHVEDILPEGSKKPCIIDDEYATIEKVYTFHPAISETEGKRMIAELYVKFGWSVIMDMVPRAELMAQKERELEDMKSSMLALQQDMDIIKKGGWVS